MRYQRIFYAQLVLLHLSLLLRVSGDMTSLAAVRQWGGLLNKVAILLFLGTTVYSIIKREQ